MANDPAAIGMSLASFALSSQILRELAGVLDQDAARRVMKGAVKMIKDIEFSTPEARVAAAQSLEYFEGLVIALFEKAASGRPQ